MKNILCVSIIFKFSILNAQYTGTGSVTQGIGMTTVQNLYTCSGGRIPSIGTINASDNSVWTLPATVNYNNSTFPFADDLYNSCNGATHASSAEALNDLTDSNIVTIDSLGEVITAFVFADNYFEMYINGVPVGKDNVPYTQFNSNIVRFKVIRPFTIVMLLVDWEENLGIGTENNNGSLHHIGDGGMVAVFKDANNNTIAITDTNWKAQTFYTSPIKDLTCPTEIGTQRLSSNCSITDSQDGSNYFGLHWNKPIGWMNEGFDDSSWPNASLYSNAAIGVNNKPAYMNFIDIFDNPSKDAQFIWSSNVILDNEVVVRYTVDKSSGINQKTQLDGSFIIHPNPSHDFIDFEINSLPESSMNLTIINSYGNIILHPTIYTGPINVSGFKKGLYFLELEINGQSSFQRFMID